MQKQKQQQTEYWKNILRVVSCPYQGQKMAFWMKSIFAVLWLISIPNGIFFHASRDYLIVLSYLTSVLLINLFVCRHHYHRWIDVVTAACLLVGVSYVFFHGCIGYFSVMFPLLFSCIAVFMLGIRNSVCYYILSSRGSGYGSTEIIWGKRDTSFSVSIYLYRVNHLPADVYHTILLGGKNET